MAGTAIAPTCREDSDESSSIRKPPEITATRVLRQFTIDGPCQNQDADAIKSAS